MQINPNIPISIPQTEINTPSEVKPASQTVHVFIEGHSVQLRVGNNDDRQSIKAMATSFSFSPLADGKPAFRAATGEQKIAAKAYIAP